MKRTVFTVNYIQAKNKRLPLIERLRYTVKDSSFVFVKGKMSEPGLGGE